MDSDLLKILIVDDDEVDRQAVRRALDKTGIQTEIYEAATYASATDILKTQLFDCIFADYRLPDRDGLALVQSVRKEGILTPLIVLTGQGDEQIAVDLMKAGASDYLIKSKISPDRISRMLRNALRIYNAERQAALANQRLQKSYDLLLEQNQALERQRQQIYQQNLQLIHASQLKSRFLATLSHELRTPLTAILGFSQMLMRSSKGTLNEKQTEMVQRIFTNGKNLLHMLSEVLDFSRIEAHNLDLKPEIFNLQHLVTATVDEVRSLALFKEITLSAEIDLQNAIVFNDPERLRQALVNLLSNAIKFTETGKVWVEVRETQSETLCISVRDTGTGIAPEHIDCIFDAFRQVDQSDTRKYSGTGLGLAITKTLVQMMGGNITVISQLGQGSTFQIEIPRSIKDDRANSNKDDRANSNPARAFSKLAGHHTAIK
ncbi:hybrid sensor histidine kinase/response regulator [Altericista sp. CCNU0014]|uniref:ATP-binding response regulator n=1 Tax=Altericista sp. CCNU0014 TaxID=3082949 RepID=UPI00384CDEF2